MTGNEETVLDLTIWLLLVYGTGLLIAHGWRLYIRDGDVVARANKVLNDRAAARAAREAELYAIGTYVNDWILTPRRTVVGEALSIERQRPRLKRRRRA